jgi:hypothetical protein
VAKNQNFLWSKFDNGNLVINLDPPTAIGGSLGFVLGRYFEGDMNTIVKTAASGFNGVSGLTVLNSGQGQFSVALTTADTSGLDYGNYAFRAGAMTSGLVTTEYTLGFMCVTP